MGTVNVSLDASSKRYLESNTYITFFSKAANVITGEYTLFVNDTALESTSENEDTYTVDYRTVKLNDEGEFLSINTEKDKSHHHLRQRL